MLQLRRSPKQEKEVKQHSEVAAEKKILEKRKEFAKMEKKLEGKFFIRSGLCYYLYEKFFLATML